ncbi:DNA polymerase III, subunit gamma and tau [Candidatus Woesebacteria bacterium RIFCSPHIGHO2_02_FULL_38_9]|uniref:DNA polymerase III subunit gamma/tau n=1 Tax=Candidatus Woesebacteria bacterium RIFCSPHIGHO2_01_FULL_39_28 TaxID=1802496 RepID=A0A1F7YHY4_9BACT|nr:MAG: DNA polymerase III, subunit gamma and tau [Candidatus Woesebacteria bacterium RIFCSPHIGHO2_01_FULL_39_28]OGM33656.1 MAG: DNA polymerase III, subunit gamma and tau [Candidatus Woesebacteria bacterium RIFCSPHIGHO2_02_FULL_38_9]OGM58523.1 MAG: DNA polymerase III, subunit gamma and tau [Candidatus Woesebacteria bacterium RIFCSPLOWO2_01_FULL_38_20]
MTLYLKYRPQTLEELDLTSVRDQLTKIVKSGKIPHAFLFLGPKGTGKTSAARILAKIINCQVSQPRVDASLGGPCNKCDQCVSITNGSNLDVIELDAASNRGIDDIRNLREGVKLAPTRAKKKVYIIDEAHMLTTEASNAFLKTLEEPPSHVIFILATTNPEKLIATVRSRLTNIVFKKASVQEVKRQLARVITGEKVTVENGVLEIIARASDGSFRDSVKILEQLIVETKSLKKSDVEEFLFRNREYRVDELLKFLADNDSKKSLQEIENVVNSGESIRDYLQVIIQRVRSALLAKEGLEGEDFIFFDKKDLLKILDLFFEARANSSITPIAQLPLEVAVLKWCNSGNSPSAISHQTSSHPESSDDHSEPSTQNVRPKKIDEETWKRILAVVKPKNASLEALLRAAKPIDFDGKNLNLGVFYKFHKERLETNQYKRIFEDTVGTVVGKNISVVFTLTEPPKKELELAKDESRLTDAKDEDIIKAAKEIFSS